MPRLLASLPIASQRHGGDPRAIVEIARQLDASGVVDGVVLPDHVLLGPRLDRYPWGTFPFEASDPWLEPLTVLTAVAAVTERLTLATGILVVPLRPAALLAKTVATVDVLSAGRVELGVGTGWQEEELAAAGVDHARRGEVLTDAIAACRELWKPGPATFRSATVSFEDVWCEPKPVRPGGPPVLFSGTLTPRNVRRIVELGDGWIPIMRQSLDDVRRDVDRLRKAMADAGRDEGSLRVRVALPLRRDGDGRPSLAATLDGIDAVAEAGATDTTLALPMFLSEGADVGTIVEELRAARS